MQLNRVLKTEDLFKIESLLAEEGYGDCGLEIVMRVRNSEILNRINEEFYYSNNKDGTPPDVDSVNVLIGGTRFKYIVDEEKDAE